MDSEQLLRDFSLPSENFKEFVEQLSPGFNFRHNLILVDIDNIPLYFSYCKPEVNYMHRNDLSNYVKSEEVILDYEIFTSFNVSLTFLKSLELNNRCIEDFLSDRYSAFQKRIANYKFSLVEKNFQFLYFGMFFAHRKKLRSSIEDSSIIFYLCGYRCDSRAKFDIVSNLDFVFDII